MGKQQTKIDDVQLAAREPMLIANLQKHGSLRFYEKPVKATPTTGARLGEYVEIWAGEEGEVPAEIWDRYKGRKDIKLALDVNFVLGGLLNAKAADLSSSVAQRALLAAQQAEVDKGKAELARLKAEYLALQN